MSYITDAQYSEITGRDQSEAMAHRIERASLLLDARTGKDRFAKSADDDKEFLINKDKLNARQVKAVEQWTAWMVATFAQTGDSVQVVESVRLGRFQQSGDKRETKLISDDMLFADQLLISTGMIRRDIDSHPKHIEVHRFLDA